MPLDDAQRDYAFLTAVLEVRDALQVIVDGEITRGHSLAGDAVAYGGTPGKRKVTLKDARKVCRNAVAAINVAVNKFDPPPDDQPAREPAERQT